MARKVIEQGSIIFKEKFADDKSEKEEKMCVYLWIWYGGEPRERVRWT
jgi:hypothetical protein